VGYNLLPSSTTTRREGGREGTHSPPTYLRNVGNAEAALEGGVAEEECLADGEEVG